jgi:tuberous sclerosis 2
MPLDPSQVFLQLFQSQNLGLNSNQNLNDKNRPILVPDNQQILSLINVLDYNICYMLHKIGVIYIGPQQTSVDEKRILSDSVGSIRYKNFLNGLGNLICLKDLDKDRYYSGGLETDGTAGDFSYLWFDGIVQVMFHVSTLIPTRLEDQIVKKKHIGNDSTIIVYNESGEEYQFGMIRVIIKIIIIINFNLKFFSLPFTPDT